jgi:hypothetical protein
MVLDLDSVPNSYLPQGTIRPNARHLLISFVYSLIHLLHHEISFNFRFKLMRKREHVFLDNSARIKPYFDGFSDALNLKTIDTHDLFSQKNDTSKTEVAAGVTLTD